MRRYAPSLLFIFTEASSVNVYYLCILLFLNKGFAQYTVYFQQQSNEINKMLTVVMLTYKCCHKCTHVCDNATLDCAELLTDGSSVCVWQKKLCGGRQKREHHCHTVSIGHLFARGCGVWGKMGGGGL